MGDKHSRLAAAGSDDASAACGDGEAVGGDDTDATPPGAPPPGEAEGSAAKQADAGSGVGADAEDDDDAAVPSESEILARLVANLGQCPGRTLALAEIRRRLPPALRRLAEDTEGICKWLRGFPGLFEVSGPPGGERITLTVGKLPRPGASSEPPPAGPPPAAGASPSGAAQGGAEVPASGAGEAAPAAPARAGASESSALVLDGGLGPADEEGLGPSMVQLRGLPFRATIGDVKAFLGEHAKHLVTAEPSIRLLLNRDGRPSGFARVQLTSPAAAQLCREALHRQPMGDRYIEVLACSDRAGKARQRRAAEAGAAEGCAPAAADSASEYLERERVLQECQEHMRTPGRSQLLLSMLGIALSQPARAYLRRANLGLKHFLARFPNEFRVEGPKGCERVIWCGAGAALLPGAECAAAAGLGAAPPGDFGGWPGPTPAREPSTPKLAPSSSKAPLSHSGQCVRTPSDWGTPGPLAPQQAAMPEASAVAGMDFNAFPAGGSWPAYGWQPWVQWPAEAGGSADGGFHKAARGDPSAGRQAATSSGKKGSRGEASASRSHAHLHPQSHPFASRAAGGTGGSSAAMAGPGAFSSAELDSAVPALRLRGLPFNVTVQDVLAFFAQHEVADRIADGPQAAQLLPKANGRPSGQAVVQMRSRFDAEVAQKALYHQFIGGRYIEVFVYGDETDLQGRDAGAPAGGPPGEGPGDAGAEWRAGMPSTPWPLPPWAGAVPPPVPGGAAGIALGGPDGEAREGDAWGQIFNWLWHGHEQTPDPGAATAAAGAAGASGPGAAGPGVVPAAPPTLGLQARDTPAARATLQV